MAPRTPAGSDDALRAQLHALLDSLFEMRTAPPEVAPPTVLDRSLERLARGELDPSVLLGLEGTSAHASLDALRARLRALVEAAQGLHRAAGAPLENAGQQAEKAADALGLLRTWLERTLDAAGAATERAGQVSGGAGAAATACERVSVLALNVALEGVRVGGDAGRALGVLGDELRSQGQRAAVQVRELGAVAEELTREVGRLRDTLADAQRSLGPAHEHLASVVSTVGAAREGQEALGRALGGFSLEEPPEARELRELTEAALRLARKLEGEPEGSATASSQQAREALRAVWTAVRREGDRSP